jgi:CRISPR-associated protein Csx10
MPGGSDMPSAATAVEWLEGHPEPPSSVPDRLSARRAHATGIAARVITDEGKSNANRGADRAWYTIDVSITTLSPVSIPRRVIGNVGESFDFIPGHHLLPLVSRALAEAGGDPAALGAGDVVVLPATVEIDGERGRPVPFALAAPKRGAADALMRVNLLRPPPTGKSPVKPLRTGYVGKTTAGWLPRHQRPALAVRTHNSVSDASQRPTERTGGVYSYAAIPAGVHLRTSLRVRGAVQAALKYHWWDSLRGEDTIGRSRKDDYGRVLIDVGAVTQMSHDRAMSTADKTLVVWCVSDVVLRDAALRPEVSADALGKELSQVLGPGVQLRPVAGKAFVRIQRLDSWHAGWSLPRASLVAIAAGSCCEFEVKGTLDDRALEALLCSGIGERRGEGFGQVIFNDPLLTEDISGWRSRPTSPVRPTISSSDLDPELVPRGDEGGAFAELVEREAWRAMIARLAAARGADAAFREQHLGWPEGGKKPVTTQLNTFRQMAKQLVPSTSDNAALRWLRRLSGLKNRAESWTPAALERALRLVSEPSYVWEGLGAESPWPTLTVGADTRLRDELWAEAVQTLLDEAVRQHVRTREGHTVSPEGRHGARN